jgi:hypothetical protein
LLHLHLDYSYSSKKNLYIRTEVIHRNGYAIYLKFTIYIIYDANSR